MNVLNRVLVLFTATIYTGRLYCQHAKQSEQWGNIFLPRMSLSVAPRNYLFTPFQLARVSDWWMRGQGHYCPGNKPDKLSARSTESNLRATCKQAAPRARRGCFPWRPLFARAREVSAKREIIWREWECFSVAWREFKLLKRVFCAPGVNVEVQRMKAICASQLQIEHKS